MIARDKALLEAVKVDPDDTLKQLGNKNRYFTKKSWEKSSQDMKEIIRSQGLSLIEEGVLFLSADHKWTGHFTSDPEKWGLSVLMILQFEELFAEYTLEFRAASSTGEMESLADMEDILKVRVISVELIIRFIRIIISLMHSTTKEFRLSVTANFNL